MPKVIKNKTQTQKNSQAFATVYETKEVLVSSLTTTLWDELSENLDEESRKQLYDRVNSIVSVQTDSLVTRLQRILE